MLSGASGLADQRLDMACPQLRADVVLGPARRRGTAVVHHLKDPLATGYHCVGAKEFFLISRLDGRRTLAEIGAEYADAFDRRLAPQHWHGLLAKLAQRRLLVGTAPAGGAVAAPPRQPWGWRSLLHRRFPLVNPDAFLGRLRPWLTVAFRPGFVVPALIAVILLEVYVFSHASALYTAARHSSTDRGYLPLVVASIWFTVLVHESSHGLTCKHYGGTVPEIGVLWRFPVLGPYCNADDQVLFPHRRHAVYTSFAGMFGHLLALPPFLAGWLLCADGGLPRGVAAATLLFGSVAALSNAVPFLRLDGYHMLNHALGMTDLAGEANRFWRALLRRSDPAGLAGYPRADRWIYGVYGAASAGFSVLAGAAFTWYLAGHVAGWLEVRRDVVALAAVGVFAASYLGFACWRRRRALKV